MSKNPVSVGSIIVCQAKAPFKTKGDALRALNRNRKIVNKTSNMGRITPYQCGVCGQWHHAHQRKGRDFARVRKEEE